MTVLSISQDTLIMLPDGATGGAVQISYNGTTSGPVIASGNDRGRAVLVEGRLARLTALDRKSPLRVVGREAGGRMPARVTLLVYPEGSAVVAPIILSGLPVASPDAPGIWDLSNIDDASGGLDVVLPGERQAIALLRERAATAADQAEAAAHSASSAEAKAAATIGRLDSSINSAATQAAAGTVARVEKVLADTAQAAAQAVDLGTQALEQAGRIPVATFAELGNDHANAPLGTWAYTADTRETYRKEGAGAGGWVKHGEGAAPAAADLARRNTALDQLTARKQSDGPQFADGSRWLWQASGTPDGGTVVTAQGGGVWAREFAGPTLAPWVDLTVTPENLIDLAGLQATLNAKAAQGGGVVMLDARRHYVLSVPLYIPTGVSLRGQGAPVDATNKGKAEAALIGTVVRMRGNAQFQIDAGAAVTDLCVFYDQQVYNLALDEKQPDGVQAFTYYPATFLWTGFYGGGEVARIVYLGGTVAVDQGDNTNPEKFRVSDIVGFATECGVRVRLASDICSISNIFFNCNSAGRIVEAAGGDMTRFGMKVARRFDLLQIGRADELHVYRAFAFGARYFLNLKTGIDSRDQGTGGGVSIVNSAGDCIGRAVHCNRSDTLHFAVKISNSFFTPMLKDWYDDNYVILKGALPCVLAVVDGAHHNLFMFSNVSVFGSVLDFMPGTGSRTFDFQQFGAGINNTIMLSNYVSDQGSVLHDSYYSISQDGPAEKGRIISGSSLYKGQVIDGSRYELRGNFVGTVTSATQTLGVMLIQRAGKLSLYKGGAVAGTGPTGAGSLVYYLNGKRVASSYFAAGVQSANFDPEAGSPALNPGDVLRVVAEGMNGAADLAWAGIVEAVM